MKELRIEYRTFGIRREVTCPVPQTWEELTPEQFLLISRFYLQEIDESSFLKKFYSLPFEVGSNNYYKYKLSEFVDFISDCRVRMDRFILSDVSGLKAPGERLKGMCFEHFMHVDTAFNRYTRDGKDTSLDTFVSMLYLKSNEYIVLPAGEKNGLFSRQKPLILQKRVTKVAKIDKHVKYAIFLNYVFVKRWLSKAFPFLFPLDDEREPKDKQKKRPHRQSTGSTYSMPLLVMMWRSWRNIRQCRWPLHSACLIKEYVTLKNRKNDIFRVHGKPG